MVVLNCFKGNNDALTQMGGDVMQSGSSSSADNNIKLEVYHNEPIQ